MIGKATGYFAVAYIIMLISRYVHVGSEPTKAIVWNAFVAFSYFSFHILSWIFFGTASRETLALIYDDFLRFACLKIVLFEVFARNKIMVLTRWIVWFIALLMCKGLLCRGRIHLEGLIVTEQHWKHYIRPMGHILFVSGGVAFLHQLRLVAIHDSPEPGHAALLLLFDLMYISYDLSLSVIMYALQVGDLLHAVPVALSVPDVMMCLEGLGPLPQQVFILAHFLHILTVHCDHLSLVGLHIVVHGISVAKDLWEQVGEISRVISIRHVIERQFEFVQATDTASSVLPKPSPMYTAQLSSEACSICLQSFSSGARRLPCGHLLHTECLCRLILKQMKVQDVPTIPSPPLAPVWREEARHTEERVSSIPPTGTGPQGLEDTVQSGPRSHWSLESSDDPVGDTERIQRKATDGGGGSGEERGEGVLPGRAAAVMSAEPVRNGGTLPDTFRDTWPTEGGMDASWTVYEEADTFRMTPLQYVQCPVCRQKVCLSTGRLLPQEQPEGMTRAGGGGVDAGHQNEASVTAGIVAHGGGEAHRSYGRVPIGRSLVEDVDEGRGARIEENVRGTTCLCMWERVYGTSPIPTLYATQLFARNM